MNDEIRAKAGKLYHDLKSKVQDKTNVFELVKTTQATFIPDLCALVEQEKKKTDNDFFVEVPIRMNALMPDVPERYMKCRHTCPTPFYDQSVFHYDKKKDSLFYLWTIPSWDDCKDMMINASRLTKEEQELFHYVLAFKDGTLLRLAKRLNGETSNLSLEFFRKDIN
jgi:hypothetical protein